MGGSWTHRAWALVAMAIAVPGAGLDCRDTPRVAGVAGFSALALTPGDFDGDGRVDLAVVANCTDFGPCATLEVLLATDGGWSRVDALVPSGDGLAPIAADLDGVGGVDLVDASSLDEAVFLRFNAGGGRFADPVALPAEGEPVAAWPADFDGDGVTDLAIVTRAANLVHVRRGLGGGAFGAPTAHVVGTAPVAIAAGDLDGDDVLDLVTANVGSLDVSFLRGLGDGTFAPEVRRALPGAPFDVTIAPVDGDDDWPDVVVALPDAGRIATLRGDGAGGVLSTTTHPVGDAPLSVRAGDVDGDGSVDLVVGNAGTADASFLRSNGVGGLLPEERVSAATNGGLGNAAPVALLPRADGRLDVAMSGTAAVAIASPRPEGRLAPGEFHRRTLEPRDVAASDFTGDGVPDLATVVFRSAAVLTQEGTGSGFAPNGREWDTRRTPVSVVLADVDGASGPDLVVACENGGAGGLDVLMNRGDGTFEPAVPWGSDVLPRQVVAADLDGVDGPDFAVATGGFQGLVTFLNDGAGGLEAPVTHFARTTLAGVAAADLDADGATDLVGVAPFTQEVVVALGDGDGTFSDWASHALPRLPSSVRLGHLDGDAHLDVVVGFVSRPGGVAVLRGRGDGTFSPAAASLAEWLSVSDVALGDVDGDGAFDVVAANQSGDHLALFLGDGRGGLLPPVATWGGNAPRALELASLDGSERLAAIVANVPSDGVSVVPDCTLPSWVLRNDEVTSLSPLVPPLSDVFVVGGAVTLDLTGPNGVAEAGTGDDDDAWLEESGHDVLDPDPGIGDPMRPLVFYQVARGATWLRVTREGDALRLRF